MQLFSFYYRHSRILCDFDFGKALRIETKFEVILERNHKEPSYQASVHFNKDPELANRTLA